MPGAGGPAGRADRATFDRLLQGGDENDIVVGVLAVSEEAGDERVLLPGRRPIHVRLLVASQREKPLPLVSPRRFAIALEDGTKLAPRPSCPLGQTLPRAYLKRGEEVSGWLSFDVPEKAARLVLSSDLRNPPIEIPIAPGAGTLDAGR